MTKFIALTALMLALGGVVVAQDAKPDKEKDPKEVEGKKTEDKDKAKKDGKKYDLRPIYKVGSKTKYQVLQSSESKQKIGDQNTDTSTKMTMDALIVVKDVDDVGSAESEMTYERIRYEMDTPENQESYDSKTDKVEGLSDTLKPVALMKGVKFTVITDKNGKVLKVEGVEQYLEAIRKEMGDTFADMMEKMNLTSSIADGMKSASAGLPTTEIALDDTWTNKAGMALPMMGKMSTDTTYTFSAIEDKNGHNCAKITFTGKITMSENDDEEAMFEVEMGSAEVTGEMWIDLKTRELVYSYSETAMEMTLTFGEMSIDSKTKSVYSMTLKDKNFKEEAESDKEGDKEDKKSDKEDKKSDDEPDDDEEDS